MTVRQGNAHCTNQMYIEVLKVSKYHILQQHSVISQWLISVRITKISYGYSARCPVEFKAMKKENVDIIVTDCYLEFGHVTYYL